MPLKKLRCRSPKEDNDGAGDEYGREDGQTQSTEVAHRAVRRGFPWRQNFHFAEAIMSNPDLPPELLDHVVDLLQDTRDALRNCCLVAKSWIPRSRRHLFARIAFLDAASLRSWKTAFPDPSTSPASYARFLFVQCSQVVTAADVEEGGWIPTFSQVVHFELWIPGPRVDVDQPGLVLIPFHGFSPALRSLRVSSPGFLFAPVSDLIHSFSCLQDLVVVTYNPFDCSHSFYKQLFAIQPPGPLAFRGTLELSLDMGIGPIASRLLSLPNSLHFRELCLARYHEEDILLTTALVERCSPTLEILKIECTLTGATIHRSCSLE